MKRIIIVAESGSDISPELAQQYGIYIVPMHVTFDDVTVDDGSIPPERIPEHYKATGRLPKTSGRCPQRWADRSLPGYTRSSTSGSPLPLLRGRMHSSR